MKKIILAGFLLAVIQVKAQHSLTKIWATDTVLGVPESVLYDAADKLLYVSLIDGDNATKDGKGEVAKLGLDGRIIDAAWVTGLNAPKGMGRFKDMLYVADLDEVAIIDMKAAKILRRIPVAGAVFLNDVTVSADGLVYISDSRTGKVHLLKGDVVTDYLTGLKGPNGLLAVDNELYVLASGELLQFGADKKKTVLATGMNPSTDGIEAIDANSFVVSSWAGVVYYVPKKGSYQQLIDLTADKINTADIGYDAVKKIVYIPTFFKNNVMAYQLK
jgi:Arylesterase